MNLFSHKEVAKNIYLVTENYSADKRFSVGVVLGSEKILVIDSGAGMAGNLRKYIEGFAGNELEMICVCTHGHSDTIGGAGLFDEVYLKSEDVGAFPEAVIPEKRINELKMFTKGNPELVEYGKLNMIDNADISWNDLKACQTFDLGGVVAEIKEIPGHTKGSIAIRILNDGGAITFIGDAVSSGLNHFLRSSAEELAEYSLRIKELMDVLGPDERMFCTHSQVAMRKEAGYAIAKACMDVALGMTAGDPAFSFGPFDPDRKGPDFRMHYAENYYIAYNADLVK